MLTFFPLRTAICALLLFTCISASLAAQCHPDLPALQSLYDATNGNDWTDNSGWMSDCEPCGWVGIGCDSDNRVTTIILRDNNLTGALPAEIVGLDRLELLGLPRNQISGNLPAVVFEMPSLKDINLSRNRFTGAIPTTLGNQPDLEYLRLSENQLTGPVPSGLSSLTQLRIIMLEENLLSGAVPEGLGDFPNLITLNFTNNNLEGCFPLDLTLLCGRSRIMFGGNSKMTWEGDFLRLCEDPFDEAQIGAPCNDGNPNTGGDVITQECGCLGGATQTDGLVDRDEVGVNNDLDPGTISVLNPGLGNNAPPTLNDGALEVYEVAVYPNPIVGNEITVTLPNYAGKSTLRLLSLTGRELLNQTSSNASTVMNLPVLEAGMYLVEVVTETSRSVKRVMVQ